MSQFDEFIEAVLKGAQALARENFGGFTAEAGQDARAFLDKTQADLQRWTRLLAARQLTEQDFSDLVQAKRALAEIHGLTQAGIALARLERFRSGLIDLIVQTAFDVFL